MRCFVRISLAAAREIRALLVWYDEQLVGGHAKTMQTRYVMETLIQPQKKCAKRISLAVAGEVQATLVLCEKRNNHQCATRISLVAAREIQSLLVLYDECNN